MKNKTELLQTATFWVGLAVMCLNLLLAWGMRQAQIERAQVLQRLSALEADKELSTPHSKLQSLPQNSPKN